MDEDTLKELLQDLIAESNEGLDLYEESLLQLERGEGDSETLNSIFRVVHSIKGSSGCIGLSKIEELTHIGENLLDEVRAEVIPVTPKLISLLLKLSDAVRGMFDHLQEDGTEGDGKHCNLIQELKEAAEPKQQEDDISWGFFDPDETVEDEPQVETTLSEEASAAIEPPPEASPSTVQDEEQAVSGATAPQATTNAGLDKNTLKELLQDLIAESNEGLDRYEESLLQLERGEGDSETLNSIFRVAHSIKGSSGCLGLSKIEELTHIGENLLDEIRAEVIPVTPELINLLLKLSDAVRSMFSHLQQDGTEGDADHSNLIQELKEATQPQESEKEDIDWGFFDPMEVQEAEDHTASDSSEMPKVKPVEKTPEKPTDKAKAPQKALAKSSKPTKAGLRSASHSDSFIRVSVDQLDSLMNLVGELVLARNQILQQASQREDESSNSTAQRINIVTSELQESVMKTRMQPIGNIWSKFPRIVRDLSQELGKEVELEMEGKDTDLDRTLIEAIKDPLTHIIRNAIDHGIEFPDERKAKGKHTGGTLLLKAFPEGGQVNIEISDDGAGLNRERILEKAIERGIVPLEKAPQLSDKEINLLIFAPGFSTATSVSHLSGRGVGMDVVRTNIEKIGGTVEVTSEPDEGTTLKLKIPLTLAIIPALIVNSCGEKFSIPQMSLLELVRVEEEQKEKLIETLYNTNVFRLRGQLLPLIYLNDLLKLERTEEPEATNILVLQSDGKPFGLIVDEILDTEEIVVKPLGRHLKQFECYSGATIMGDGSVSLILDIAGLAEMSGVLSQQTTELLSREATQEARKHHEDTVQRMLVFTAGADQSRMAVPLSMISRLEEFDFKKVERSRHDHVIQYRGEILRLIDLAEYLSGLQPVAFSSSEVLQVIVYEEGQRQMGIVVNQIVDIIEETFEIKRTYNEAGLIGSTILQERVTDLLDIQAIIEKAAPDFFVKTA